MGFSRDVTICYRDFPINRTAEANVDSTWLSQSPGGAKPSAICPTTFPRPVDFFELGSGSEKPKKTCSIGLKSENINSGTSFFLMVRYGQMVLLDLRGFKVVDVLDILV